MANSDMHARIREILGRGTVIPACPLALTSERKLDERRQRALVRYYSAAGAGGLAVGVHTTQFAIRDPKHGLFEPVLSLVAEELDRADSVSAAPKVRIAGICGDTAQAAHEAELIRARGYHAGLLSLAALRNANEEQLIAHCRTLAEIVPLVGFYLQPAVGGRVLPVSFWRKFAAIPNVVAIKIAPFNRYQTMDVVRAVAESGREDIALYTGNDDAIVHDLISPFRIKVNGHEVERHCVGGLLGHWAVWTSKAVELHRKCREVAQSGHVGKDLLERAWQVTDANAAFFDAPNDFAGCIAGLHEVLRRQGLFEGIWCLDPEEGFSPGQIQEIDRVYAAYPYLNDDDFVVQNRDKWLAG